VEHLDSSIGAALSVITGMKNSGIVLYGCNIVNNEDALVQTGSGYRTLAVVDSALSSASFSELTCGDVITRTPNTLSFNIPLFFRGVFIVAQLNHESGNSNIYNRVMLEYGEDSSKEIARAALTSSDRRCQSVLIGSYSGLAPSSESYTNKLTIQTYGTQQYFGANVVIGILL